MTSLLIISSSTAATCCHGKSGTRCPSCYKTQFFLFCRLLYAQTLTWYCAGGGVLGLCACGGAAIPLLYGGGDGGGVENGRTPLAAAAPC
jgi:hypothetical protein